MDNVLFYCYLAFMMKLPTLFRTSRACSTRGATGLSGWTPTTPSRILPPSWRGRLLIYLVFGVIPVYEPLRSRELL